VAGRTIAGPGFSGDDGSADPAVTAALAAFAAGQGGEHAVLAALDSARLLVPLVAVLTAAEAGPGGVRQEKSAQMALPTVIGTDGRAALPAFTCAASLARWQAGARPVAVPAAQVWRSGATDASAVIIDIAGPVPFAVDGARLAALAGGRAAPMPWQDPDVAGVVHAALAAEPVIAGYRLLPGEDGTDLTLCLVPAAGAGDPAVLAAAERASGRVAAGAGDRVRRGIGVAVLGTAGPGEPAAG